MCKLSMKFIKYRPLDCSKNQKRYNYLKYSKKNMMKKFQILQELESLPGGHKTASVVISQGYGIAVSG